jgi:competence protein ComEC
MNHFAHIPLARLIVPFTAGIIVYLAGRIHFSILTFFSVYLLLALLWLLGRKYFLGHYARRWIFGTWAAACLLVAGYHIAQSHHQLSRDDHFSHFNDKGGYLLLKVREPVSEKTNSWQVIATVKKVITDEGEQKVSGRLMLYLQKDSLAASVRYGDFLLIENNFQEVSDPKNPGEFNYRRFLSYSNIFHQAYRSSGQWQPTGQNKGFFLVRWSLVMRHKALKTFEENHLSGREFAVVSALLLGFREYLDEDLRREFAGAGAMHILCVSGLHVGIIFLVLKFILSFLKKIPRGRIIQTVLVILLIWFYAAITGFSPSVLRASTMFSFVALGQSFRRTTSIYNTLAASAFLLMIIDPYIITRIGFQLSYLAVISIVALQPFFYQQLYFKNYFLDKAWAILTVSLAAQLATGPLSLFYFHQFPNYFLLTNLIVIPLASLIIYSALATLLLTPIPVVGMLAGKVLFGVVFALHQSVKFIEGLPYSTSSNVFINLPETLAIFMVLIFLNLFFMQQRSMALRLALGIFLLVSVSISARSIQNLRNDKMVVYHVNNACAIDFVSGKKSVFLMCETLQADPRKVDFHLKENRVRKGIRSVLPASLAEAEEPFVNENLYRRGPFFRFGQLNLFLLDQSPLREIPDPEMPIHYLIISQNSRVNPQIALEALQPQKVIIDASNTFWNTNRWEEACQEAGIEVWPVRTKGAYVAAVR